MNIIQYKWQSFKFYIKHIYQIWKRGTNKDDISGKLEALYITKIQHNYTKFDLFKGKLYNTWKYLKWIFYYNKEFQCKNIKNYKDKLKEISNISTYFNTQNLISNNVDSQLQIISKPSDIEIEVLEKMDKLDTNK